ncbi:MAG: hypothetical protein IJY08_00525 [Clostridia bacterium]|nr:hypothetical protein [Clostridia bacterium]
MEQNAKQNIEITTEKQKQTLTRDGLSACIFYIASLPAISEKPRITDFYRRIADECAVFCQKKLFDSIGNTDHQYTYRLTCKPAPDGDRLSIALTASLYDKTSRKIIYTHTEEHLWDTELQMMVRQIKNCRHKQ